MKSYLATITTFVICAGLTGAQAQFGPRGGGMMGGQPHGPDFSGPMAKIFGDHPSFSATMDMQSADPSSGGKPMVAEGKIAVSDGKSRFEIDMAKAMGSQMPPEQAASMKAMGLDSMVMISRPDLKVSYMVYPGMNAYVETAVTNSTAAAGMDQYKITATELGRETVDGHACVKNKVVVTDDQGGQHESTVWNATDLNNFPVKIESNESGVASTMTFKDIKFDKVAPSQFEAPAGATKYSDMMTLMQQQMMKRAMQNHAGGN
jgi:hypothetical protein